MTDFVEDIVMGWFFLAAIALFAVAQQA